MVGKASILRVPPTCARQATWSKFSALGASNLARIQLVAISYFVFVFLLLLCCEICFQLGKNSAETVVMLKTAYKNNTIEKILKVVSCFKNSERITDKLPRFRCTKPDKMSGKLKKLCLIIDNRLVSLRVRQEYRWIHEARCLVSAYSLIAFPLF